MTHKLRTIYRGGGSESEWLGRKYAQVQIF